MGTNCAPLVSDLFEFYYERDFVMPLSNNYQTDNIEALTPPPDIEITYLILIILILNKW